MRRTIWLDMDGVLADYDGHAATVGVDPQDAKDRPGWFRQLPVIEGAKEGVRALRATGAAIRVLSTPPSGRQEEAAREKKAWLQEHFPELAESAVFTQDKASFGLPGDVLVDDHPGWNGAKGFKGTVVHYKGVQSWAAAIKEATKEEEGVAKADDHMPDHDATEAQKRAGNYRKGHLRLHGIDISIENLAGSTRRGKDGKGQEWAVTMPYHYGYIRGTEGADGDHLDVAIGPMPQNEEAHVINQRNPQTGAFDEHKVFLGFPSREAAIQAFRDGRSDDPDKVMIDAITIPIAELKRWIKEGGLKEQAILKAEGGKAHVKAHYRNINGKIVYVQDYDKTVHGDHPEATLQERTILKQTKHGHTIQVTDAEDNEKVKEAMAKLGIEPQATQHTGASHHGVKKAVFQHHFLNPEHAQAVHAALGGEAEAPKPGPDTGPKPETQHVERADTGPDDDDPVGVALMEAGAYQVHADDYDSVDDAMDSLRNVTHALDMAKQHTENHADLDAAAEAAMTAFASFAIHADAPLKAIMLDLDNTPLSTYKHTLRRMVGGCRSMPDLVVVEAHFRRFIAAKKMGSLSFMGPATLGSTIASTRKMGEPENLTKLKNIAYRHKGIGHSLEGITAAMAQEANAIADTREGKFLADSDKTMLDFTNAISNQKDKIGYVDDPKVFFTVAEVAQNARIAFYMALGDFKAVQQAQDGLKGIQATRAAEQKCADYITADLPTIVAEAHKEHSAAKFKLAAVISAKRAEAEERKKGGSPETAKNLWSAAASFAALAKQG